MPHLKNLGFFIPDLFNFGFFIPVPILTGCLFPPTGCLFPPWGPDYWSQNLKHFVPKCCDGIVIEYKSMNVLYESRARKGWKPFNNRKLNADLKLTTMAVTLSWKKFPGRNLYCTGQINTSCWAIQLVLTHAWLDIRNTATCLKLQFSAHLDWDNLNYAPLPK